MRLALFTKLVQDRPLAEVADLAAEIGYDGLEIMCDAPHLTLDWTDAEVAALKEQLDRLGLDVCSLATYTRWYATISDTEAQRQLQDFERFLHFARLLDCKLLRHDIGGPAPDLARPEDWQRGALWGRRAADLAAAYGATVTLEIHFGYLTESAESSLELLAMIDRPNVRLLYDAGNMLAAGVPFGPAVIRRLGEQIAHVHVKDQMVVPDPDRPATVERNGRYLQRTLLGRGQIDHAADLQALAAIGYRGYVASECYAEHVPLLVVAHEAGYLKGVRDVVLGAAHSVDTVCRGGAETGGCNGGGGRSDGDGADCRQPERG